jgi:predicted adenine nucleotide alpha hydrolase (AANH) superfamily ATPase
MDGLDGQNCRDAIDHNKSLTSGVYETRKSPMWFQAKRRVEISRGGNMRCRMCKGTQIQDQIAKHYGVSIRDAFVQVSKAEEYVMIMKLEHLIRPAG